MKTKVLNGIDNLAGYSEVLRNRRLGIVCNPSAIDRDGRAVADILNENFEVTAFFGPEHGFRGDYQNGVHFDDSVDPITGKPVYALYGKTARLTAERLTDICTIVYDIQDVGSKAFSYLRTLALLIEDLIELDRELVVLDRINPLGGVANEGPLAEPEMDRYWGYGVPARFGLTIGEYAKMVNARYFENRCRLTVIPCANWKRTMNFEDCGLFWCNPAPNLPNPTSALIYAGCVAFGQTSISEARGTTRPYEMYGSPAANGHKIADKLNALNLPGVIFRPCAFTAQYNAFQKYVGETCRGVMLFINDKHRFNSFETGIWMLEIFREMCPDFAIPFANGRCASATFDGVLGSADWRTGRQSTTQFIARGRKKSSEFEKSVQEFLLYS